MTKLIEQALHARRQQLERKSKAEPNPMIQEIINAEIKQLESDWQSLKPKK